MKSDRQFNPIKLVINGSELDVAERQCSLVLESYKNLNKKNKFSQGQMVKWKAGLRNRKRPLDGEPAIVTRILRKPVVDTSENNSASQYFYEPLDAVIGIWDDGEFNELHVDSRRLCPF